MLDPNGRDVAKGELHLSDFGTAASKAILNAEAATGTYTLRVEIAGRNRLVPHAFAVQYYRRPTFELKVNGLPDKPGDYDKLKLDLSGEYYFGKAVADGTVAIELLDLDSRKTGQGCRSEARWTRQSEG